jgi:ethanolamine utilization cobalamin adenosyltransferase
MENIRNRDGKRVFYLGKGDQLTNDARDYLTQERIPILPAEQAKQESYKLLDGGTIAQKPEHMTHLNAQVLVSKTHPRIGFRGAIDLLEAQLLLCQSQARDSMYGKLQEALDLARLLIRCDVMEESVPERTLGGMDQQALRSRSHLPQKYYGQPHFMPEGKDSGLLLQINLARTAARQAELAATHAFSDRDGNPTRPDILQALNRMSSMLYILMLREKAT